jgi:hypothetical protein
MPIDFPNSPSVNDIYTVGNRSWKWTGSVWESVTVTVAGADGADGANGTFIQASTAGPTVGDGANGDLWIVYS